MKLCLDSLTLNDTEPADLIRAAKSAGFDLVSLWVQPPSIFPLQLVTPAKLAACRAALAETGIQVGPLEVFNLTSAEVLKTYRPALELGARLGAKSASAINVGHTDPSVAAALFAQLADMAREFGLGVTLEPLAMFATATLEQAREIITLSGIDAGIVLDAFHIVRKGGTVADVRAIDPAMIGYVQLCDGAIPVSAEQMRYEASYERMLPGGGDFPLIDLLRDVRTDINWGIEAPSRRRAESGMGVEQQAKLAMQAIDRTLARIQEAKASA